MQAKIQHIPAKILTGKSMPMKFNADSTPQLWQSFMPLRRWIENPVSTDLYSVQIFPDETDFTAFLPETGFIKWAAVELESESTHPELQLLHIPEGLYAVFQYKGDMEAGIKTIRYIFSEWLPVSEYMVDNRPHFSVMGEKYKHNHPESEEEICIPIRKRK